MESEITLEYENRKKEELIAEVDTFIKRLEERNEFARLWAQECCDKGEKVKVWIDNRLYMGEWKCSEA